MILEQEVDSLPDAQHDGPVQQSWRFQHEGQGPLASMCAYEVRQLLKARGIPIEGFSVCQSRETFAVVSRNPQSSRWMTEHVGVLLGVVADIAGQVMAVSPSATGVSSTPAGRRLFTIPALIVERSKKSADWNAWKTDRLDEPMLARMSDLIRDGIRSELRNWGAGDFSAPIIITNPGRPMPIVPESGPRGMGRLGVKFLARQDLSGQLFVGAHTLLGYGRVLRGGLLNSSN